MSVFRRFKVVEGRSKAVAECLPALPAANDKYGSAAPKSVAANKLAPFIGYIIIAVAPISAIRPVGR
jgi:hypothetical protein